jgi:hypothetical protein
MSEPKIDLYDPSFEEERYPCFSIKVLNGTKEIDVCRDKKTIKRFKQESFEGIDFNNVDDISKLIKILKYKGCVGLMNTFNIRE